MGKKDTKRHGYTVKRRGKVGKRKGSKTRRVGGRQNGHEGPQGRDKTGVKKGVCCMPYNAEIVRHEASRPF